MSDTVLHTVAEPGVTRMTSSAALIGGTQAICAWAAAGTLCSGVRKGSTELGTRDMPSVLGNFYPVLVLFNNFVL